MKGCGNFGRLKGRRDDLSRLIDVEGQLNPGGEWKIAYEGSCSRREHGRLDVPSTFTMSLAPVDLLILFF